MQSKWFAPALIGLVLLFGAAVYPQLPDNVPSHWDLAGQINGTQPKALAVLFSPALMAIIWVAGRSNYKLRLFGRGIELVPARWVFLNLIVLALAIIQVAALGNALGWQIPIPRVVMMVVGLLLALMGNQMRRLQPNFFIGIRTPWTLRDPEVWRRTHVYGGRVYFFVGWLVVVLALLLPTTESLVIGLAADHAAQYLGGVLLVPHFADDGSREQFVTKGKQSCASVNYPSSC